MANNEKWEKVQGKAKSGKSKSNGKMSKTEKQAFLKSMTTIDDLPLSKTQSMMFDKQAAGEDVAPVKPAKVVKKKPKKPVEPKITVYKTIEEAAKSGELKSFDVKVKEMQEKFPENQLLWCKEVASYLNLNLLCTETLNYETARAPNYPLSQVSKSMSDVLLRSFGKKLRAPVVPLLYKYCLNCMVDCIARDQCALGYQLCLQALAQNRQQLCLEDYEEEKIVNEVISYRNAPKKCFAFLWAIAQTATRDGKVGFQTWLRVMLPTLDVKCVSNFNMDFIETLLKEKKTNDLRIKFAEFYKICEWTYTSTSAVTKAQTSIKKRVEKIYNVFETAMMKNDVSKQEYFVCFLDQPNPKGDELSNKLVELAISCLQTDNYCVTYWRDHYLQNIDKTRLFIEYFNSNPEELRKANKRKVFNETIRSFRNTNEDLIAKSDPLASKSEFHIIQKFCKSCDDGRLQNKSSRLPGFLWSFIILLVGVGIGVVMYDVKLNNDVWEGCQTQVFLKDIGAIALYHHVQAKVNVLIDEALVWYEDKFPQYSAKLKEILTPYGIALVEMYETGTKQLVELCEPIKLKLQPYFEEYVQEPLAELSKICAKYALEVTNICLNLFTDLCKYLLHMIKRAHAQFNVMLAEDFDWMQYREDVIREATTYWVQICDQASTYWIQIRDQVLRIVEEAKDYISAQLQ